MQGGVKVPRVSPMATFPVAHHGESYHSPASEKVRRYYGSEPSCVGARLMRTGNIRPGLEHELVPASFKLVLNIGEGEHASLGCRTAEFCPDVAMLPAQRRGAQSTTQLLGQSIHLFDDFGTVGGEINQGILEECD